MKIWNYLDKENGRRRPAPVRYCLLHEAEIAETVRRALAHVVPLGEAVCSRAELCCVCSVGAGDVVDPVSGFGVFL